MELIKFLKKESAFYSNEKEYTEETGKIRARFERKFGKAGIDAILKKGDTIKSLISCGKHNDANSLLSKLLNDKELTAAYGSINSTPYMNITLYYNEKTGVYEYPNGTAISDSDAETKSQEIFKLLKKIVVLAESYDFNIKSDYVNFEKQVVNIVEPSDVKYTFLKKDDTIKVWLTKYLNVLFPEKFFSFFANWWLEPIFADFGIHTTKETDFVKNGVFSLEINKAIATINISKEFAYYILLNYYAEKAFVFSASDDEYDIEGSFRKNGHIDWGCKLKNVDRHSTVYLYVTKKGEEGRICHKCKVEKRVDLAEKTDDSEFWKKPSSETEHEYVRLVLEDTCFLDILKYTYLKKKYKFTIYGKLDINHGRKKELRKFLKDCFDNPDKYKDIVVEEDEDWDETAVKDYEDDVDDEITETAEETAIDFEEKVELPDQKISNKLKPYVGKNVIFYGVPGCGKSRFIKELLDGIDKCYYKRILFHPEYSYGDFIGQIIPTLDKDNKPTYEFKEGPMLQMLKLANDNENKQFFLIIEEINRGNAPAIFGDFFQLLDRNGGKSEYSINNAEIEKKLNKKEIEIPKNLTILATMNTCDQNVFTLDTAFKRRFRMTRIKNSFDKVELVIKGKDLEIEWKKLGPAINTAIVEKCNDGVSSEDKQLGAYFVHGKEIDIREFAEKVLMYLWDDVVKYDKQQLFKSTYKTLDSLIDAFCEGKNVFADSCADIKSIYDKIEEEKAKKAEEVSEIKPEEEKETPEE